jgi:hypothetical protein
LDDEGEEDGSSECDNGEYDEGEGADATYIAERIFGFGGVRFGMVAEVNFTYPCRAVEEEGKPACEV